MEAADVWSTLAKRIGAGTFLQRAFPILLAWLERGVGGGNYDKEIRGADRDRRKCLTRRRGFVNGARGQSCDESLLASPESDSAAECEVQVAAAASISTGLFECLGECVEEFVYVIMREL